MDVLAINSSISRMGQQFLVCGTQSDFDARVAMAMEHAQKHACTVWAVNIGFAEGGCFSRQLRLPAPDARVC